MHTLFGQGFRFWTNGALGRVKKAVLSSACARGLRWGLDMRSHNLLPAVMTLT